MAKVTIESIEANYKVAKEVYHKRIDKMEWLYRFKFVSYLKLHESIKDYIDWYNTKRLHSSLGYLTPLEMELKLKGVTKKVA